MLWKFTNTNKYGHFRTRVVSSQGPLTLKKGLGPVTFVNRFYYDSRSAYFGFVVINNKK